MKLSVKQTFFAVAPAGYVRSVNDFIVCPSMETAEKTVDEEYEMTGIKPQIIPIDVFIPMEFKDGQLVVSNNN